MLTVTLSKEIEARLENIATITGHTKTLHSREAILKYFDDLESFYLAEKHFNDTEAGVVMPII
jgi:RHH-type rel operon transcriptional repressor/antitoxin RelB